MGGIALSGSPGRIGSRPESASAPQAAPHRPPPESEGCVILADTSVWIDHLNRGDSTLQSLLDSKMVVVHPFVIGELALGRWPHRAAILYRLRKMSQAPVARDADVLRLIEDLALSGSGIGYMDAHLLASVLLTSGARVWTRDKALRTVARQLALDAGLS
jgi:predicted nucleic acid-binding protein